MYVCQSLSYLNWPYVYWGEGGRGGLNKWFTQNFTSVIEHIIDLLLKRIAYICFDTLFGILPNLGPMLGAPKSPKNQFWENPKWPPTPILCLTEKNLEMKVKSQWITHELCQIFCPQMKTWNTRVKNDILYFLYFVAPINGSGHFICYEGPEGGIEIFFFTNPLSLPILSHWK